MKLVISLFAIIALLGTCTTPRSTLVMDNQTIEYQVKGNQYVVVVAQDGGVTEGQAKEQARKRAAEITVRNGARYFTIDSEERAQVTKSDQKWPNNQAFYGNMYQELIIERDFGRNRIQAGDASSTNLYPAYRMVFQIFKEKPSGKSIDACTLTDCSQ